MGGVFGLSRYGVGMTETQQVEAAVRLARELVEAKLEAVRVLARAVAEERLASDAAQAALKAARDVGWSDVELVRMKVAPVGVRRGRGPRAKVPELARVPKPPVPDAASPAQPAVQGSGSVEGVA
jgi:hypothetical protein